MASIEMVAFLDGPSDALGYSEGSSGLFALACELVQNL